MPILVTGGSGFIGSHFLARLSVGAVSLDLVPPKVALSRHVYLCVDVCDFSSLVSVLQPFSDDIDCVVHLAGKPGVRDSFVDPTECARANICGFLNVLKLIENLKVGKLVFASSSSVLDLQSPYAVCKRSIELFAQQWSTGGCSCVALRFFTVYGPGGRPDMAVGRFIRAAKTGEPMEVFGDGSARRQFTYVDDAVDGIFAALTPIDEVYDVGTRYSCFDIGGPGEPASVNDLVQIIAEATGTSVSVVHRPAARGDTKITRANNTLIQPKIDLKTGIQRTLLTCLHV